jgi:gamma-glutamyl-gamma-aminobutyrate hydrolase PuuD
VLNVACGGKLLQHIERHRQGEPRDRLAHSLQVREDSRLAEILGTSLEVNTHHHQAVRADALGAGLRPVAWSPDGIVEAFERPGEGWLLAVQWHPERVDEVDSACRRLAEALVEQAARARRQAADRSV